MNIFDKLKKAVAEANKIKCPHCDTINLEYEKNSRYICGSCDNFLNPKEFEEFDDAIEKMQKICREVSRKECIALINEMEKIERIKKIRSYLPIDVEATGRKIKEILNGCDR